MLDYKSEELKRRQQNTKKLRDSLSNNKVDKSLHEKIVNFCEKHSLEYELIKYKIIHDDLFVLNFIKDPTKQSIHQELAAAYIKKIPGVSSFQTLPAGGKNALYVINGIVLPESMKKNSSSNVKSIDFEWIYTNHIGQKIKCYASHKYTHAEGGAQDNQYHDATSFLSNAMGHQGNDFFYAICDGDYYQRLQKGTSLKKIDYLNNSFVGPNCKAITVNDLESHMASTL